MSQWPWLAFPRAATSAGSKVVSAQTGGTEDVAVHVGPVLAAAGALDNEAGEVEVRVGVVVENCPAERGDRPSSVCRPSPTTHRVR
jgi:hypothetical protein